MNAPTTSIAGTTVQISVTAPSSNGGSDITSYAVELKGGDGTFTNISQYCDFDTLKCSIPIATLTASPFNVPLSSTIVVRAAAINSLGQSPYSDVSTAGATLGNVPAQTAVPTAGAGTTTSIPVSWTALTPTQANGAPILSYSLEWDQGTSTWVPLTGGSSNDLATTYTVTGNFPASSAYKFRVKAKNLYGWGPYSTVLSVITATVPAKMAKPTLTLIGNTDVLVSWALPSNGGANLTSLDI